MPVNSTHPEYSANADKWQRCRDAYSGSDAVLAAGERYLPRIPGQSDAEYRAYQTRPCFYEMTSRTIDGLVGAVTRLPHDIRLPLQIEQIMHGATLDDLTLDEVIKGLLAECLLQGRAGILVDINPATNVPYFTTYTAECIVNWGSDFVILQEDVLEPDPEDRFKLVNVTQYRELHMVDGQYTVTVWRKTKLGEFVPVSEVVPTRRGKPLTDLPFAFVTPAGSTTRLCKPPMLGVVDLALQHFRLSADHHHGLFHSSLPTLWVAGIDAEKTVQVGGAAAILLPDPNARVNYAEFSGAGLGAIRLEIENIERRAAAMGASVLLAERERANQTATEATIRSANQMSLLSAVANGVEDGLTKALKIAAFWAGAHDGATVAVNLNAEFVPARMDSQMVASLVQGVQAGAISVETFQAALAASGVIEEQAAA